MSSLRQEMVKEKTSKGRPSHPYTPSSVTGRYEQNESGVIIISCNIEAFSGLIRATRIIPIHSKYNLDTPNQWTSPFLSQTLGWS